METQTWRKGDIVGNGRFEIRQELGTGGFGITYLAYDRVKKQQIAIKTLNSNQQREGDFAVRQKKFEDEGFTLRGLPHPHIVRVYERIEINGLLGFTMEYIPGQDLAKYVKAKGRLSEAESLRYIDQISLALDYVHQNTVFHRDVNPRNIMLRQDRPEAVLIDFGLAREFAELEPIYLSNTDGSELYKPVEQYKKGGVFGPPTDIYALAVTLYFLLNGAPLGSGKNWIAFTSISRKRNHEIGQGVKCDRELWAELINVGVSDRTLSAIQAGMAIEPEDRPKNMTEFRELLGLVPSTSLPEMPTLSYPEIFATSQPIQNLPEPPVVVMPTVENLSPGLTASIPTKSKTTKDAQDLPKPSVPSVVTTAKKESPSPGLTASISSPAKSTEDIKKKVETVRSAAVQGDRSASPHPNQRPSKKMSPVSRRLFLQGLLGTGGLAGFGLVGLLLKNLFESKSTFKPVSSDLGSGGSVLFNTPVAIPKVDAPKNLDVRTGGSSAKRDTSDQTTKDSRASTPLSPRQLSRLKPPPSTGLSTSVQAKSLQGYFQGRWRADPDFDGSLQYKVKVGRNGKVISLEGADERSRIYLNKTGFLKPGETVSKNGQQDQKIYLILNSTGEVQTLDDGE
jgi:serine/threonine protein kinase